MKTYLNIGIRTTILLLLFLITAGISAGQIDLSKAVPLMRLPDGRVLKNVQFVKFGPDTVTLKSHLGPALVRYEFLPDDVRAEAEKQRPGGPKWFPGETAEQVLTLQGQVFVQTRGAGSYQFGGVKVYAFDSRHLREWETNMMEIKLPKPLSVATTDGDGRFKMKVPKDVSFFIYCYTSRLLSVDVTERNEWRVPFEKFKSAEEIILSHNNVGRPVKIVKIEEHP